MKDSRALIGALAYFSVIAILIAMLIATRMRRKSQDKS